MNRQGFQKHSESIYDVQNSVEVTQSLSEEIDSITTNIRELSDNLEESYGRDLDDMAYMTSSETPIKSTKTFKDKEKHSKLSGKRRTITQMPNSSALTVAEKLFPPAASQH